MERRVSRGDVRENRQGVHERFTQETAGQMPAIVRPEALEGGALDELSKDGSNLVAPARECSAEVRLGILFPAAEGRQQFDSPLGKLLAQARRQEVAAANADARSTCGRVFCRSKFLAIARRDLELAADTRPADTHLQAEAV